MNSILRRNILLSFKYNLIHVTNIRKFNSFHTDKKELNDVMNNISIQDLIKDFNEYKYETDKILQDQRKRMVILEDTIKYVTICIYLNICTLIIILLIIIFLIR